MIKLAVSEDMRPVEHIDFKAEEPQMCRNKRIS